MARLTKSLAAPISAVDLHSQFQRDGAMLLRGVFTQAWIDTLRVGIERNMAAPGPHVEVLREGGTQGRYFGDYLNWQRIPEFLRFVLLSPAKVIAATAMNSKTAVFYHEHVLVKEPGTLKVTPWHADQPYYPVDGSMNCSMWIPVDPVAKDTCAAFVLGSHRWSQTFFPRKFATATDYTPTRNPGPAQSIPDIDADRSKYNIATWDVEPGDCILFHMKTVHGAPSNSSLKSSRRVFVARWLGDDAVLAERPWEVSPPITGGLRPGQHMACPTFPRLLTTDPSFPCDALVAASPDLPR
eukprot:m.51330 g.51330  ORF g.51330 m.51330 type:complete len:297 (+) comp11677_c0_seq3:147-1037(+)